MTEDRFSRSAALLGAAALGRLAAARVLLVGVGGVGSWCAEALVRTGLGHLALVDDETIAASNLNRQCPATVATLGRPKVEAMRERLLAINPACEVTARRERFGEGGRFDGFDLVVDAIDSVGCKAELILAATGAGVPIVSSMGAARRTDPTKVRVTRFEKVEGDGLARALRRRFRKTGRFPAAKFACVWSAEVPVCAAGGTDAPAASKGSLMMVTATFGMCLAAEAVRLLGGAPESDKRGDPSICGRECPNRFR